MMGKHLSPSLDNRIDLVRHGLQLGLSGSAIVVLANFYQLYAGFCALHLADARCKRSAVGLLVSNSHIIARDLAGGFSCIIR